MKYRSLLRATGVILLCCVSLWLSIRTIRADSLRIAWNPPPNHRIVGYHVYRSDTPGGPYTRLTAVPVSDTEYSDETALPGHRYYYVVTTVSAENKESAFSAELPVSLAAYDAAPEPGALIARAKEILTVRAGEMVVLSASHNDPQGGEVTYTWTQLSGPTVALSGATLAEPAFLAPLVPSDSDLVFVLSVTDEFGGSMYDFVRVTVLTKIR